jgi:hypothetical protein
MRQVCGLLCVGISNGDKQACIGRDKYVVVENVSERYTPSPLGKKHRSFSQFNI